MSKNPRSRGWCFTVNNYDDLDCAILMELYEDVKDLTYLIVGFEIAPKTKTPHIQGYMYFREAKSFNYVKKILGDSYHIESQKSSTNVKAYCYCMEDLDYWEIGERPRQGHRTDLEVVKHDLLTKKKTMKDVSKEYFAQYCQYSRQFKSFTDMNVKYKTRLLVYNEATVQKIYTDYLDDLCVSLIYENSYYLNLELLHNYYSGRYKYIFIPNSLGVEELDIIDSTLYD